MEDTNVCLATIQQKFGTNVAKIVDLVSDDKSLLPSERKVYQIESAHTKNIQASRVKLADKYDNCLDLIENTPKGWTLERIQGYFLWSREVVNELVIDEKKQDLVCNYFQEALDKIFKSEFHFQGQKVPCIPKGDRHVLLQDYYDSLDKK